MEWPIQSQKTGKPSTTPTNQAIWKAAIQPAAREFPEKVQTWLGRLDQLPSQEWRHGYIPFVQEFVQIQAKCSKSTIVSMCRAGVEQAQQEFVFRLDHKNEATRLLSLKNSFERSWPELETVSYRGGGGGGTKEENDGIAHVTPFYLASPHGCSTDDEPLWITGKDAVAQLKAWQTYGCMEPSAATHAQNVVQAHNASVFVQNKTFVLLGVTSEMGPTKHLLRIPGAHVMGVARNGARTQALLDWFQQYGSPAAKLTLVHGGADLLKQGPQIARWIVQNVLSLNDSEIVLMPLAYMDGEANCRVTVAMDAICSNVLKEIKQKISKKKVQVTLVYYTSPTTCYIIPKEAVEKAKARFCESQGHVLERFISWLSLGQWLQPSNTWKQLENDQAKTDFVVYNGIVDLQGPNYCLAKTMQQWQGILALLGNNAADDDDHGDVLSVRVLAPHAPATRTKSVTHNANAAAALNGLQYVPPNVTFDVAPCSSLMTAIILSQLQQSLQQQQQQQQHPLQLFWDGSVHGGGWQCPYNLASCYTVAYLLGKTIATTKWCPAQALAPKPTIPLEATSNSAATTAEEGDNAV